MPIALRPDFDAAMVRAAARRSKDGPQARRLLALAAIYEGATRTEASKIGGVTLQIIRDWVLKFNAHGPEGLIDRKAPGPTPRLNDEQRAALTAIVESGPIPAAHGVVRWRIVDLCQWIWEEFRVVGVQADDEPRTARPELSQAVGPSSPSCAGGRRDRGF
jgi:transposase